MAIALSLYTISAYRRFLRNGTLSDSRGNLYFIHGWIKADRHHYQLLIKHFWAHFKIAGLQMLQCLYTVLSAYYSMIWYQQASKAASGPATTCALIPAAQPGDLSFCTFGKRAFPCSPGSSSMISWGRNPQICTHHTAQAACAVTKPGDLAQAGGRSGGMPEIRSIQVGSRSSHELSSEITRTLPGTEVYTLGV